jgi:hypothetical protein
LTASSVSSTLVYEDYLTDGWGLMVGVGKMSVWVGVGENLGEVPEPHSFLGG